MAKYLGNAFSLQMVNSPATLSVRDLTQAEFAIALPQCESVVGHPTTAALLSTLFGEEVKTNRVSVKLDPGDVLYVAQYNGPRLEEGTTELPEGASFRWMIVTVN